MIRRYFSSLLVFALAVSAVPVLVAQSQGSSHAAVLIPDTTIERPEDIAVRAHTNHLILYHPNRPQFVGTSPAGETPQSIRAVYNIPSTGGSGTIAIVDAFDYPTAENDLNVFSQQFGLPPCTTANGCFQKVFATGTKPRKNCGWAQEAALDIEWAHAMAPSATIVLVEAKTNFFSDLFQAVDAATSIATAGGAGEVSMSWGGSEFSSETSSDSHFQNTGVVYFAASGDTGGVNIYPSVSPLVVSAGGTTINRDRNGNFVSETAWSGGGGGPSAFEPKPSYQNGVENTDATHRSAPDFSFDSDPNSGVSVYDSTSCQGLSGWLVFGGTSVASPSLAGIVNLAGHVSNNSTSTWELTTIYPNRSNSNDFRDIVLGSADGFSAKVGYDMVTGVGSDQGLNGK